MIPSNGEFWQIDLPKQNVLANSHSEKSFNASTKRRLRTVGLLVNIRYTSAAFLFARIAQIIKSVLIAI
jgi:hypothetical protein